MPAKRIDATFFANIVVSNENVKQWNAIEIMIGSLGRFTLGRPPWYDSHGQLKEAFIIGKIEFILKWKKMQVEPSF